MTTKTKKKRATGNVDSTAVAMIASSVVSAGAFCAGFALGRGVLGRDALGAAALDRDAEIAEANLAEVRGEVLERAAETRAAIDDGPDALAALINTRRDEE